MRLTAALLMSAGVLTGLGTAAASAATCQLGGQPPSPGDVSNELIGVAEVSACNAWAVGDYRSGSGSRQALIVHWDGTSWTQASIPGLNDNANSSALTGVSGTSASDIWAVGRYDRSDSTRHTLILHYDGSKWIQVASPSPGSSVSLLSGVTALSANNAWAVGDDDTTDGLTQNLVLQWDGNMWSRDMTAPSPGTFDSLNGLSAASASDVWAVGYYSSGSPRQTLTLHYDGSSWTQRPSPTPDAGGNVLVGVAATSASNAWAVGGPADNSTTMPTILRWDGNIWTPDMTPPSTSRTILFGVSATSASDAWAVGGTRSDAVTILHWDGTGWTPSPGPTPSTPDTDLAGVTATSASDAWAVGTAQGGTATTVLHWDGAGWTQATGTPPPPPPPPVTVPDLTGDNTTEASAALQAAGLVLGTVRTILDPACVSIGRVISQSPAPSATAPPGSAVVIWIGRRNPAHPCR